MKKILLMGLAFAALIMPAMAADLAPYYRTPAPPVVWDWTGLYIGANVGWISTDGNISNTGTDTGAGGFGTALALGAIPGSVGVAHNGFIGGGQIGYNWQVSPTWVLGIEVDFDDVGGKASTPAVFPGSLDFLPITTVYNRELDSLGTFRGRFGYLLTPGVLWYATGGLAYAQTKLGTAAVCPTFAPPCSTEGSTALSSSNTSIGWTAGTGVEWRFAPAWSLKFEYLYVDLGSRASTLSYTYFGAASSLTSTVNEHDNIVRLGINYKLF